MSEEIEEKIILRNLVVNEDYYEKIIPYISEDLFTEKSSQKIFECIKGYQERYSKKCTLQVLEVFQNSLKSVNQELYNEISDRIEYIRSDTSRQDLQWLIDETVEFIRRKRYYQAVMDSAMAFDKGELDKNLPEKIQEALGFDIDSSIGLEFSDNEQKWSLYTDEDDKIPFLLNSFNRMTNGGVTRKTLNCLMSSSSGGGKTMTKCCFAAGYIQSGLNVLYITLEMAEKEIIRRIDANLLGVPMDDIVNLGREEYLNRINRIQQKTMGRMIVKQYPSAVCTVNHIRVLLKDLKLKENFVPDILIVDYMGLMVSNRYKNSKRYEDLQAITEELRGLAIENNIVVWSSVQSNRSGMDAPEELAMDSISESYGMIFGLDCLIGIVTTDEFRAQNKILFKALKNRYQPVDKDGKFFMAVDYPTMTLTDFNLNNSNYTGKYASDADFTSSKYNKQKMTSGNFSGIK